MGTSVYDFWYDTMCHFCATSNFDLHFAYQDEFIHKLIIKFVLNIYKQILKMIAVQYFL